jgi:hypothetical protein
MTSRRHAGLGIVFAFALLGAAWQLSADSCTPYTMRVDCRTAATVAPVAGSGLFLDAKASRLPAPRRETQTRTSSDSSQRTSLVLLGIGLALVAKTLKRQKSTS